jgi:hypothetical protein
MQLGDCLGGYCFFDDKYEHALEEPRFIERGKVTQQCFDTDARILEINSKSGLYPLYMAYGIYRSKLASSLFSVSGIDNQRAVWDDVVRHNLFVICKTPMAKSITKRTLVGFRDAKVNTRHFEHLVNQIKNKSDKFVQRVSNGRSYWNANDEENMKFTAIVGNPPYQVMDGGGAGTSAISVYNYFVDISKQLKPTYISMIMPARWYSGGKGLDDFRKSMLQDNQIREIYDYPNPKDCFPTTNISGGVCYILWKFQSDGLCNFVNIVNGQRISLKRYLSEFDILIRYNRALSIVRKIGNSESCYLDSIVSARNPFNLDSSVRGASKANAKDDILVHSSRGMGYIPISKIDTDNIMVDKYKLLMGKVISGHIGETNDSGQVKVIASLLVAKPNEVSTDSYLVVDTYDNEQEVKAAECYLRTRFARFLLLQALVSMNISRGNFRFVPLQDFTDKSDIDWSKSIAEIDAQLYKKYKLSEEDISFIENTIKPM